MSTMILSTTMRTSKVSTITPYLSRLYCCRGIGYHSRFPDRIISPIHHHSPTRSLSLSSLQIDRWFSSSSPSSPLVSPSSPSSSSKFSTNSSNTQYPIRKKRIAIVGTGPSGCYTAKYLLLHGSSSNGSSSSSSEEEEETETNRNTDLSIEIDMFERLPTCYGLVRNGVAPDHPEVKNVQNDFDQLFEGENDSGGSADGTSVRLFANVTVGTDVSLNELRERYDAVVLAAGCEGDRSLPGITDQNLLGVLSARQFVNWYNGHQEYDWVGPQIQTIMKNKSNSLSEPSQSSPCFNVVVIGHGNVALDCARILAKTTDPTSMEATDLTKRSVDVLSEGRTTTCRNISIVGRRGHVQAAATIKEIRELTKLTEASFILDRGEVEAGKSTLASKEELKQSRPRQRIDKLLMDHLKKQEEKEQEESEAMDQEHSEVRLRFLMNPIMVVPREDDPNLLGSMICERTHLVGDEPGKQKAQGTGEQIVIDADLCLVSIGYLGVPIPGTERFFDMNRGVLNNEHGRVLPMTTDETLSIGDDENDNLAPLYVSGWLKRGPSGIIGTNIPDAKDTVASILYDFKNGETTVTESVDGSHGDVHDIRELLSERNIQVVDWEAYKRIDEREQSPEHKRHPDQPREKITSKSELLEVASG